jgi:hypothetical protein
MGNGCRLMRRQGVLERVDELRADFRARCGLQLEYLQSLLLPLVEVSALDFFEPKGEGGKLRLKGLDGVHRRQGLAVSNLKLAEDGSIIEIRFHSKTEAARALMASLGIGESKQNLTAVSLSLGQRLDAALAQQLDAPAAALPRLS